MTFQRNVTASKFREEEYEGRSSYETSVTMYGTTWCHILAESHHPSDCSENNKSHLFRVVELFLPLQVIVSN